MSTQRLQSMRSGLAAPFRSNVLASAVVLSALGACATVEEPTNVDSTSQVSTSPTLEPRGKGLKRKVCVARFTNETLYGKSALLGQSNDLIGRQASDILMSRLTQAGQFVLFERNDSDRILEALDAGRLSELGLPADHLILGSVSEFGRETVGEAGFLSRTKRQRAHARVNVRLVEVRTGRVLFATEGAGEAVSEVGTTFGIGTRAGYDTSLNDQAISAAIGKVVANLYENLLDQPWQSYVLRITGSEALIGGGRSQGLAVGQRMDVWQRGETVVNPQTNMEIELPGTRVAMLLVAEVLGETPDQELSRCTIVEGNLQGIDLADLVVKETEEVEHVWRQ